MKRSSFALFFLSALSLSFFTACEPVSQELSLHELVNPFIGTGGHGHTYPGATIPFGMVQISPDTRLEGWDGCGGYHYTDSIIYGFSHTHLQGTGISDYADVLIMPTGNSPQFSNDIENGYPSAFKKSSESAVAGYYSVHLDKWNTSLELTSSERCGYASLSASDSPNEFYTIDLLHRDSLLRWQLRQYDEHTIVGERRSMEWASHQQLYFAIRFSDEIESIAQDGNRSEAIDQNGKAVFSIKLKDPAKQQRIVTALSATGIEGAIKALESEGQNDFDTQKRIAQKKWDEELSKIEVKGGSKDDQVKFYTALYHSFTVPNLYTDVDGKYLGMDEQVHEADGHTRYTVFSLWDTYRATHPLYSITQRERTLDFINSFLGHYKEGGKLPMWELAGNYTGCMIGYHAVPVIVDAYSKGITNFDTDLALEAMISAANADELGKREFAELGFIPMDAEHESVSKALEYAYNDWCIAYFAEQVGKAEIAEEFYARAQNYKNHFDPSTGFMRARFNGGFMDPFDPTEVNFNFTEANSWQYSFYVPQDVPGLIALHGGKDNLDKKLDELFSTNANVSGREQPDITGLIGQYAHGNEPSHHMAYLYNYVDKPEKTQAMTLRILEEQYQNAPDGLSGNEDCGQMSSWYVMSALGIYSVAPGSQEYVLSSPLFDEAQIHLENGNTFKITKHAQNGDAKYIKSIKLNGAPLERLYLLHDEIMKGGDMVFEMTTEASEAMVPTEENSMPCHMRDNAIIPVPVVQSRSLSFKDTMTVDVFNAVSGQFRTMVEMDGETFEYSSPILLDHETMLKVWNERSDNADLRSSEVEARFVKRTEDWDIRTLQEYSSQYTGGGEQALIDGLRGGNDFRTGFWQGYFGTNVEVIVDLKKMKEISYLGAGFLEDIKPWIWYPSEVRFYTSMDGENFTTIARIENDGPVDDYTITHKDFGRIVKTTARYVKMEAINPGPIPEWHLGKGNPRWIFVDEIIIK